VSSSAGRENVTALLNGENHVRVVKLWYQMSKIYCQFEDCINNFAGVPVVWCG
jgi:hypothetical protein